MTKSCLHECYFVNGAWRNAIFALLST